MNRFKLIRLAGLSLILSAAFTTLPAFAERLCSCNYCSQAGSSASCNFNGTHTTCGEFLAVTLCLPQG